MAPVSEEKLSNGAGKKSADGVEGNLPFNKEIYITGVSGFPSNTRKIEELKKLSRSFEINVEHSNEIRKTIEAILDAGYHPSDIEGTKTGVYVENNPSTIRNESLARDIHKFFKLKGSSFECETSLLALNEAFLDLKNGKCDMALVYGSDPLQYFWMKLPDTELREPKSYYCILLQKGRQLQNVYSSIIHIKTLINEMDDGISSAEKQQCILEDFYQECKIDMKPLNISETRNGTGENGQTNGIQTICNPNKCIISRGNETEKNLGLMVLSNFESNGDVAHVLFKWNVNEKNNGDVINILNNLNEKINHDKNKEGIILDTSILFGRKLANAPPGEEVCITGFSGAYPNSANVEEFMNNLFTKTDMIDDAPTRWTKFSSEIPQRSGKIPTLIDLDAGFFGIHYQQAQEMDPALRVTFEKTIEAIFDAGMNPSDFEGTRTGVFLGMCWAESEAEYFLNNLHPQSNALTGVLRTMLANRISYLLKLKGVSINHDTACSSSSYAFENAYAAIRKGECDSAIVLGCNLCLHPNVTLQFYRLGVLSQEGRCASFDEKGNGYCRSEAICSMILQKAKDAKRVYAKVVHAKTNCDGFKDAGITFPSRDLQQQLLEEFYFECEMDPKKLTYLEAHATGTKVGDPEEFHAIDSVFCKGRKTPLHVGSIKSNIGHTESASGLCSISKCLIAMETGFIPPNIHYNAPRPEFQSIIDGKCIVVTEKTPLPDKEGLMAVSSFGFGGANAHILIKWNDKEKMRGGKPVDDIPRLVCVSGRVPEAVPSILRDVYEKYDAEHIRLLHQIFRKNVDTHHYRGYGIVSKNGKITSSSKHCPSEGSTTDFTLTFGHFCESWKSLSGSLMKFSIITETISRISKILQKNGIVFDNLIKDDTILSKIIGSVSLQIGIIELLNALEIKPRNVVGYSIGEIANEYYKKSLNIEQAILTALELGKHLENETEHFYLVKLTAEEVPKNVQVVRKCSENQTLVTAKREIIEEFIKNIKKTGIADAFELAIDELLIHSRKYAITEKLKKIIPESNSHNLSAESLVLSMTTHFNPEKFNFKSNSLILEVGHGNLSKLLKPLLNRTCNILDFGLSKEKDGIVTFLEILGSLYENGINLHLHKIYPEIEFPVSRGTPMISSTIKWNHSMKWPVMDIKRNTKAGHATFNVLVSTDNEEWQFVTGHVIDGRNLFPATGYLYIVFKKFIERNNSRTVVFENCRFNRATSVGSKTVEFVIQIFDKTGNFEVSEGDVSVVTGTIRFANENEETITPILVPSESSKSIYMNSRDVYKELRLRGYNYSGMFRKIKECNNDATKAMIEWDENWVSFMDNMLQMLILQNDSRLLCVPTEIKKLRINYNDHLKYTENFGEEAVLPVYAHKETGIIQCGAIEMKGLKATPISRKKETKTPIIESYEFCPNEGTLELERSLKINAQIALENSPAIKVPVVEIIDEATNETALPLGQILFEKFSEQPLIQAKVTIIGKVDEELSNVTIEPEKKLKDVTECFLIVGSKLFQRPVVLQQIFGSLKENGFVLSREELTATIAEEIVSAGINILTVHTLENEKLVLFRKSSQEKSNKKKVAIKITENDKKFNWLKLLQHEIKNNSNITLYAENEKTNGILGLFNCIRWEYTGMNIKCVITYGDNLPPFDADHAFYSNQLGKNMTVNIFKNGKWGTYRHLTLNCTKEVEAEHCFVNTTIHGDLSSLTWLNGPLSSKSILSPEENLIHVYYTSLNFKDIMIATGRIQGGITSRLEQECPLGFEFAGKDETGKRVMGLVSGNGAISTLVKGDKYLLFDIPDNWSLEDAATVPAVYSTVLFALLKKGEMKKGESILIHSGTGGVGQAAINVALAHGCKVYTTVGTPQKREIIKKLFPQLTDHQIGNSRDLSFEKMIKRETGGRGVDLVLNSLAEEKLLASVRCLARGGRFIEIGKFDLESNNRLCLMLLKKECTFHGVMLEQIFKAHPLIKRNMSEVFIKGLQSGVVKPIQTNIFKMNQVEEAFRFMASGKHTGKVLIQVREEDDDKNKVQSPRMSKGTFRYTCDPDHTYILIGGLGGFGLELADWLVLRGARKLVLTSRAGVKTGYQQYRISKWKSYGAAIKISTVDVTTREGCEELITEAQELGTISSIFNLAVVLRDALLENQTEESFETSFGPKAIATMHLDEITRRRCHELKDFIVFSSVSCGRGNAGQTNYGMANSVMERICEQRKENGYPALAIEWGAIGDVGLVAEMQENYIQMEIGGTLQQTISSCLHVLNKLLGQDKAAVVSSVVVAEQKSTNANNMVEAVAAIIGINVKTVGPNSTLAELGMDSMTATEIKQTLERDFEIFLTAQDIRSLTLAKLKEMQENRDLSKSDRVSNSKPERTGLDLVMGNIGDDVDIGKTVFRLPSLVNDDSDAPYVFFFPGIEGVASVLKPLASKLKAKVIALQYEMRFDHMSYDELSEKLSKNIEEYIKPTESVHIVSHSWGAIIALETMSRLEKKGHKGTLNVIDGSPDMTKEMFKSYLSKQTDEGVDTDILCQILLGAGAPLENIIQCRKSLLDCSSFEERIEIFLKETKFITKVTDDYKRAFSTTVCNRLKDLLAYDVKYENIKSKVNIYKPVIPAVKDSSMPEDYNLRNICENVQDIIVLNGDHVTMLDDDLLADSVNGMILESGI